MALEVVPGWLTYRIFDRINGVEVVHELGTPHEGKWTINGMQQGGSSNTAVGDFTIPLFPPDSDEYGVYESDYNAVIATPYLRVEAYSGPVLNGPPKFSGVITGFNKTHSTFELVGKTDAYFLATSLTWPGDQGQQDGESLSGAGMVALYGGQCISMVQDNFDPAISHPYAPVPSGGTWTPTTTPQGDPGISVTGPNGAFWGYQGNIAPIHVAGNAILYEVAGWLTPSSGPHGGAGITLNDSHGGFVVIFLDFNSATGDLDAKYQDNLGTTTLMASAISGNHSPNLQAFQLSVCQNGDSQIAGTGSVFSVFVNGKSVGARGAALAQLNPSMNPLNAGLFFQNTGGSITNATCVFTNFVVLTRPGVPLNGAYIPGVVPGNGGFAPELAPGVSISNILVGRQPQKASGSFLDQVISGAAVEGQSVRFTPMTMNSALGSTTGTFPNQLPIPTSFYASIGFQFTPFTDRTSQCIFEWGTNLVDVAVNPNAEIYSTSAKVSGQPGAQSGGTTSWRNVPAMNVAGVIEDNVPSITPNDFVVLQALAHEVSGNKVNYNLSKSITVLRDGATADVWRELDSIQVHDPVLGLNRYSAIVIAYTYEEGSVTQDLTLDQYSGADTFLQIGRLANGHDAIASIITS